MPAWVVPAAIAAGGAIINSLGNWRARKINERYVREQNAYNSPKSQMARYQSAGLNPALVYGQGTPGNQASLLSAPEGMSRVGTDAVSSYNQSRLADTQQQVGEARVNQSRAMAEVNKVQAEVLRRNPLLNDEGFTAIISGLKSAALEKAANATSAEQQAWYDQATAGTRSRKVFAEVANLEKQFDLLGKDEAIKAEVLKSKGFQNAMLEVQQKFLTDGDIGPQQILEFVKLFLMRIKPR